MLLQQRMKLILLAKVSKLILKLVNIVELNDLKKQMDNFLAQKPPTRIASPPIQQMQEIKRQRAFSDQQEPQQNRRQNNFSDQEPSQYNQRQSAFSNQQEQREQPQHNQRQRNLVKQQQYNQHQKDIAYKQEPTQHNDFYIQEPSPRINDQRLHTISDKAQSTGTIVGNKKQVFHSQPNKLLDLNKVEEELLSLEKTLESQRYL